jgi:hypothetical protein
MTILPRYAFVVLVLIASGWPSRAFAQASPASSELGRAPGWLAKSLATEAAKLAGSAPAQTSAQAGTNRSWPGRHPVLLGTLIGTGVGTAVDVKACNLGRGGTGCSFWLVGAGAGAFMGLLIDQSADSTGPQSGTVAVERAVNSLGVGRRVVVTEINARRTSGAIHAIDLDRFSVIPEGQTAPVEILFSEVRALKKPMSTFLKIAIAAGVGVAVLSVYGFTHLE